jgi:branched-chain amino acid transport system permease protein
LIDLVTSGALAGLSLDPSTLPQQLVNGLLIGAIYALIALGYTMVYGVLRLINFAHGEVFMLGAYAALFVSYGFGYTADAGDIAGGTWTLLAIMLLVSMISCAIVGAVIEFFAYRPMRNQTRIAALITAIGVSLLIQYGGQLFLPAQPPPSISEKVLPADIRGSYDFNLISPDPQLESDLAAAKTAADAADSELEKMLTDTGQREFDLEPEHPLRAAKFETIGEVRSLSAEIENSSVSVTVPRGQAVMFGTVVLLMTLLWWLVMHTRTGRAMRAASHDFDSASLMGINVNRVVTITFIIGSALAGAGAMMNATFLRTPLTPFFGFMPGVKAFVAAVLGGIGNIPGAVLGGFVMGLAETLVVWAGYGQYKDAVAFVILIVILLFRPGGLLGSSKVEKV